MKKSAVIGIIFVSIVGTLLHFTYEWSSYNSAVGIFSAVNESVWEHLKLLFWPTLLYSVFEFPVFIRKYPNLPAARFISLLIGMAFIVVFHYTISGIVGTEVMIADIMLFFAGVILTFVMTNVFVRNGCFAKRYMNIIALLMFIALAVLFAVFTNNPPSLGIFEKP